MCLFWLLHRGLIWKEFPSLFLCKSFWKLLIFKLFSWFYYENALHPSCSQTHVAVVILPQDYFRHVRLYHEGLLSLTNFNFLWTLISLVHFHLYSAFYNEICMGYSRCISEKQGRAFYAQPSGVHMRPSCHHMCTPDDRPSVAAFPKSADNRARQMKDSRLLHTAFRIGWLRRVCGALHLTGA